MNSINIAGVEKYSVVDGPGLRYVLFFQGCNQRCIGCHNPSTQIIGEGKDISIDEIVTDVINTPGISGVTISGGEPFLQFQQLYKLCVWLKEVTGLNLWVYTGYTYEKIKKEFSEIKTVIDTLVTDPFLLEELTYTIPYVGSRNQRIVYFEKGVGVNGKTRKRK